MHCHKKVIVSGAVTEIEYYQTLKPVGVHYPRAKNFRKSSELQQKINQINREKHFERLINCNFRPRDLYITLTYEQEPGTEEQANKDLENYIRRRLKKKNGAAMRYLAQTELIGVRMHHHMIVNRMSKDLLEELWEQVGGHIKIEPLYQHKDYAKLARYLCKERKRGKTLHQSKGLQQPVITTKRPTKAEMRAIRAGGKMSAPDVPGAICTDWQVKANDFTGLSYYARYIAVCNPVKVSREKIPTPMTC